MKKLLVFLALWAATPRVFAHDTDDPLLFSLQVEQLEWREGDALVSEGDLWLGRDLQKFWLKFDLEYADDHLEEVELQALYGLAIAPYWDVQFGVRQDVRPQPSQTWGVLALHGLAPYFFETDLSLYVGEGGAVAANLTVEYELLLTQNLILAPEISLDLYGQNDRERSLGSGVSEVAMGLRLRYEIRPEFAPYVGVHRWQKRGNSADFARQKGEETVDTIAVVGLRFWF